MVTVEVSGGADTTVLAFLEELNARNGACELFAFRRDGAVCSVSCRRFLRDVRRLAARFDSLGLRGRFVVIDGRNTYENVVAIFAAVYMGAVAAPVNFDLSLEDIHELLRRIAPALVVFDRGDEDILPEITDGLSARLLPGGGTDSVQTILAADGPEYQGGAELSPSDPALLLATSGSTDRSKLVLLPRQAYARLPYYIYGSERNLLLLPLYHVGGLRSLVRGMSCGPVCLSNVGQAFQDMEWFQPKDVIAVPGVVSALIKRGRLGQLDMKQFHSITSVGAPQDEDSAEYLRTNGVFCPSAYGATETGGTVVDSAREDYRPGSVGRPGQWNELRISERGEVLVRGSMVMLRYLDDPAATAEALDGGWYHTGDLGYIDGDGFLFITGRIKNIIILSNGENVSPEAVERKLSACADIEEAVVRGENDRIVAEIWCGPAPETQERVRAFIKGYNRQVPSYHAIRDVRFRDEPFAKTANGKIRR